MFDNMKTKSTLFSPDNLHFGEPRLLIVDKALALPINKYIKLLVTSADVLHSFAVPGLGIKLDACPGRLVATTTLLIRPGLYFGQCSEICGVNHGFMPIAVFSYELGKWYDWYATQVWLFEQEEALLDVTPDVPASEAPVQQEPSPENLDSEEGKSV
jgi:heme/copper-type cytochrome/quinol oxidase subunit 2